MKKYPSCAILLAFLKKKKRVGDFYYFIVGDPNSFQERNYRRMMAASKRINKEFLADSFDMEHRIKTFFISMLGDMCSGGLKSKSGDDLLYRLYLDWCHHINKNWNNIYNEFKQLMKKEYGYKETI